MGLLVLDRSSLEDFIEVNVSFGEFISYSEAIVVHDIEHHALFTVQSESKDITPLRSFSTVLAHRGLLFAVSNDELEERILLGKELLVLGESTR